ncbi:MAG: hypothetical protein ACXABY_04830 [Candidatus Thorarchaeota archaeon]
MKKEFKATTTLSYFIVILALFILLFIDTDKAGLPRMIAVFTVLMAGIGASTLNVVGWSRNVMYPYPRHKQKAAVLWVYGSGVALLIGTHSYIGEFPWYSQVLIYVLSFVYLTTLTFGILPYYGGAYQEYWEIDDRKRRASRIKPDDRELPARNDGTLVSFEEVCGTCLSALMPDDGECWRCGEIVRVEIRRKKRWTEDLKSKWRKRRLHGQKFWERESHPNYLYVDEYGITTSLGVDFIFAIVKKDGRWSLHAMPRTAKDDIPHVVLLGQGRERSPRAARNKVNSVIMDLDPKKIVEEN